jgi:hypothetical protein
MSQYYGICQCAISTPQIAINSSQLLNTNQNLMQWAYVSTVQAVKPGYIYQYKSQTERIQSLMGGLTQCRS